MKYGKRIPAMALVLIILILITACAVKKETPPKKATPEKPSETEKKPTQTEKEENTPKNEEKLEGPTTAKDVKDGTYEGKTEKDERGNYGIAKITVKDGKVTKAEYTEYTEDNKPKSKENGYDYEQALEAFKKLPEELKDKQDLKDIDTYAGATGSTKTFKAAVMKVFEEGSKK